MMEFMNFRLQPDFPKWGLLRHYYTLHVYLMFMHVRKREYFLVICPTSMI